MNARAPHWFGLVAAGMMACSASRSSRGFDLQYSASDAPELAAIAGQVRAGPTPTPVAVVVPPAPARGFTVFSLPSGLRLGQVADALLGRPAVVGDLVVARVPGFVVAWTFEGRERWRLPDRGLGLVGAAREGRYVALTLGGAGVGRRNGALLVVDADTGAPVMQRLESHAFGAPAMAGTRVFVPWDGQNLSVFDATDGDEVARVRSRDDLVGFARREGPAVWFGARALYRFGPEAASGRRDAIPHAGVARDDLPGNPPFAIDPYVAIGAGLDARERVRLAWRPDGAAPGATFAGSAVYSLFHRDLFALEASDGRVRWAYVHPADVAGLEVARTGVALVDENGRAVFVDATSGRALWRAELGVPAAQVVLQIPEDFAPSGGVTGEQPLTMVDGLARAASGNDLRLMPAQLFAVRALATVESPEATRALVAVLGQRNVPQELRAAAGEAIAHRTNGADAMLEALAIHQDYVRSTAAPPSGMLARGLLASHERRAVQPLLAHLHDPATPASDLPAIVSTLRELADPAAVPPLIDFLRLYHADVGTVPPVGGGDPVDDRPLGDTEPLDAAMEQAVLAVGALGGPAELRELDALAAHPRAPFAVRGAVARVHRGEAQAAAGASTSGAADMEFQAGPARLSHDALDGAFLPERPALLDCLRGVSSRPATVRIQFRYDSAGAISHVTVNPAALQACMGPVVERVRLPENTAGRDIATYNLSTFP